MKGEYIENASIYDNDTCHDVFVEESCEDLRPDNNLAWGYDCIGCEFDGICNGHNCASLRSYNL